MGGTLALVGEPDIEPPIRDRLELNAWNPIRSLGWFRDRRPHASRCVAKPAPEYHEVAIRTALDFSELVRGYAGKRLRTSDVIFFRAWDRPDLGGLVEAMVADHGRRRTTAEGGGGSTNNKPPGLFSSSIGCLEPIDGLGSPATHKALTPCALLPRW